MTRFVVLCLTFALVFSIQRPAAAAPLAAQIESTGHVGGSSLAVAVQGEYAFVGQSAEFAVVDISDPAQPRRVAYLPVAANDIVLRDGFAYVTNAAGLTVIDVRQPAQPVQVGFQPATSALGSLAVAGDYAYAGAPGSGLFVYAISEPAQPQLVASLGRVQVEGLAAQGDYLYLATGDGVQIVSIADPRRPALETLVHTPASVESVVVAGSYVYLAVAPGALLIADLVDPAAPRLLSSVSTPTYVENLQVVGDTVYLANGNRGVAVVDAADRAAPRLLGVHKVGALVTDVAVADNHLLATDVYEGGLHLLAVGPGGRLAEAGVYRAPGMTQQVAAEGRYAYLVTGTPGDITIVDYADPLNPRSVGSYPMPERVTALRVSGDWLYAYSSHAVQVLNISDRTQPAAAGVLELGKGARVVAVHEHMSFVDDGHGLLHIYDASAPGMPQSVGLLAATTHIRDVAVTDKLLLAAAGSQGVLVAHNAGQLQPAQAQTIAVPGSAEHVAAWGDTGYVLTGAGDLYTLDLRAPAAVRVVGKMALGVQARAMLLRDGRIYLAAGEAGFYVLDGVAGDGGSAGSAVPGRVRAYDTPGVALNIDVADGMVLVADGYAGLLLLHMNTETAPVAPPASQREDSGPRT
jgi:hypothetical protein